MLRNACPTYLVVLLGIISLASAQSITENQLDVSFSYGSNQLLPSLIKNSSLEFDRDKLFSDIWVQGEFKISEKLSYKGSLQVTDQPHELIGTNYSRPDYPLSTARVQRSVLNYSSGNLTAKFGRDDMLSGDMRPVIFRPPSGGDGFSWNFKINDMSFKHVFQVLPAESSSNQVFRRSVSYHHLTKTISSHTFGAGEYFILTGEQIGFDLKRLNPFLPYVVNSHDSAADNFSGFSGDSDNSLIKLFWEWHNNTSTIAVNLYVDEFQIDAVDREVLSDAMLLSLSGASEVDIFNQRSLINLGFSKMNPNFGQHPGPFTTTTIGAFPLFEYSPGMQSLYFFETQLRSDCDLQISISGFTENWVPIMQLSPGQMNLRAELKKLKSYTDSRLSVEASYKFTKVPMRLVGRAWIGTHDENSNGVKVGLHLNWGNLAKL
jgi:hypothetical protein